MRKCIYIGILLIIMGAPASAENYHLGDLGSKLTWVYLCGLTDEFDSPQEVENRNILDSIGRRQGIRFLALHPFNRCLKADNKLCWIHYTPQQASETLQQIKDATQGIQVAGFIGFSNGGYFLNEIAQMFELEVPIISIGAAGTYRSADYSNDLTLIVGRQEAVYANAADFVRQAKGTRLSIKLIEHDGDHILPEQELEQVLGN